MFEVVKKFVAVELRKEFDGWYDEDFNIMLDEGVDIGKEFKGDVDFEENRLFSFGEFSSLVVYVEDGEIKNWGVGGFEDNRGHEIDAGFVDKENRSFEYKNSNRDFDSYEEEMKVWDKVFNWFKG